MVHTGHWFIWTLLHMAPPGQWWCYRTIWDPGCLGRPPSRHQGPKSQARPTPLTPLRILRMPTLSQSPAGYFAWCPNTPYHPTSPNHCKWHQTLSIWKKVMNPVFLLFWLGVFQITIVKFFHCLCPRRATNWLNFSIIPSAGRQQRRIETLDSDKRFFFVFFASTSFSLLN